MQTASQVSPAALRSGSGRQVRGQAWHPISALCLFPAGEPSTRSWQGAIRLITSRCSREPGRIPVPAHR